MNERELLDKLEKIENMLAECYSLSIDLARDCIENFDMPHLKNVQVVIESTAKSYFETHNIIENVIEN